MHKTAYILVGVLSVDPEACLFTREGLFLDIFFFIYLVPLHILQSYVKKLTH